MTDRIVGFRYMLHPGPMTSKTDGDRHFIGAGQLAQLYGVSLKNCVVCDNTSKGSPVDDPRYIHLYPRYNGDYEIPGEG